MRNQNFMKALLTIAALTAANVASAAPQTIYFAGSIYSGFVGNSETQTWEPGPVGGRFSGSITFDGTKGTSTGIGGVPSDSRVSRSAYESGTPEAIVSSFTFNYGGNSYFNLSSALPSASGSSGISKSLSEFQTDEHFQLIPRVGAFHVGGSTTVQTLSFVQGVGHGSQTSRSLYLYLRGTPQFVGDIFDLANLPNLDKFNPTESSMQFGNSSYSCIYAPGVCPMHLEDGGVTLSGRFTYLSTTPLSTSELPEPGSLALLAAGLVGLAAIRRKAR
jgi:hypothetical protein